MCFKIKIMRLALFIGADDVYKEEFYEAKEEVLSDPFINEPDMIEYKQWLKGIEHNETDYSRVEEILNTLTAE